MVARPDDVSRGRFFAGGHTSGGPRDSALIKAFPVRPTDRWIALNARPEMSAKVHPRRRGKCPMRGWDDRRPPPATVPRDGASRGEVTFYRPASPAGPSSSGLEDLDEDERFFVQTTSSDPIERLGRGKEKDQHPSNVVRTRRGQAYRGDPALVDRGHTAQIERDRPSGTDAGHRLEQPIGVLGQQRTDKSQRARGEEFDLHPAIVGRSAARSKTHLASVARQASLWRGSATARPTDEGVSRRDRTPDLQSARRLGEDSAHGSDVRSLRALRTFGDVELHLLVLF